MSQSYPNELTFFKGSKNGGGALSVGIGASALFLKFAPHDPSTGRYDFKNSRVIFKVNMPEIGKLIELAALKIEKGSDGKAPQDATLAHFNKEKELTKVMSVTYSKDYQSFSLQVYDAKTQQNIMVPLKHHEMIIFIKSVEAAIPYLLNYQYQEEKREGAPQSKPAKKKEELPVIDIDKEDSYQLPEDNTPLSDIPF